MSNYDEFLKEEIKDTGLVIVKLGGAAITNKRKDFSLQGIVIDRVLREIKASNKRVIIIHGAGSYGHNLAKFYEVSIGNQSNLSETEQRKGISLIRTSLESLHSTILKSANDAYLFPFSVPISSTIISKSPKAVRTFFTDTLALSLMGGFIPLLYGDVCFDEGTGFTIVSGDRIIKEICEYFVKIGVNTQQVSIIFGSNVDGIYTQDPTIPGAELMELIEYKELDGIIDQAGGSAGRSDVTGGMRGKLVEMKGIVNQGFQVSLVNITIANRLLDLLVETSTICTKILPPPTS
ncbi:MAG: isopentenyl phosphate kinase [Candidatus Kariarchaeaceae archaeon]|jgi:isopentenyl phosphate kinase